MDTILSMLQAAEAVKTAERNLVKIKESNLRLAEALMKRFGLKMPDELTELMRSITVRCGKAIPLLYAEMETKSGEAVSSGVFTVKVGTTEADKDRKTGFPLLFISSPELEESILAERQRHLEKIELEKLEAQMAAWLDRREAWLRRRGVEPSDAFKKFVYGLPPMKTSFDGSRERVARIAKMRSNVEVFGNPDEDDIFAVAFDNDKGDREMTIFVAEIDFRKEFADKLIERLGITPKLARRISDALPHDRWYGLYEKVRNRSEVLEHSALADKLGLKEGAIIQDLLQGPKTILAFDQEEKGKKVKHHFIDVDPKNPSVILVRNVLNVYVPDFNK